MKKYILNLSTRKKLLSVILCGAMVCGIMTGCGDNVTAEAVNTSAESQAESQAATGTETAADTAEANAETAVETTAEAQQETVEEQPAEEKLYLAKRTLRTVRESDGEIDDDGKYYYYTYQYDENGNQIKKWYYSSFEYDSLPFYLKEYKYDNNGNIFEEYSYDIDYYDNTRQIDIIAANYWNDQYGIDVDNDDITSTIDLDSIYKYTYDENGNYSVQSCYNSNGKLYKEFSYWYSYYLSNPDQIYDARETCNAYDSDGSTVGDPTIKCRHYIYDDAGNMIEMQEYDIVAPDSIFTYYYTYDESGYLINEKYSTPSSRLYGDHTETVYEYDTLENLLAE